MLLIGTLLPEAAEGQAGKAGSAQGLGGPLGGGGSRPYGLLQEAAPSRKDQVSEGVGRVDGGRQRPTGMSWGPGRCPGRAWM